MWRVTKQLMRADRRTTVPAGIAVAIGAFVICAAVLLGDVLANAVIELYTIDYGGAQYRAQYEGKGYNDYYDATDDEGHFLHTFDSTGMSAIGNVEGVSDVRVQGSRPASLTVESGAGSGAHRAMYAVEVSSAHTIMPYELADGKWPEKQGEVALDEAAASTLGASIGDTVTVDSEDWSGAYYDESGDEATQQAMEAALADARESFTATITGITHDGNDTYTMMGGALTVTPDDMALLHRAELASTAILDKEPQARIDYLKTLTRGELPEYGVYFAVADGYDKETVARAVKDVVDPQVSLTSREDELNDMEAQDTGRLVTAELLVFAFLAVFMGALVISNTFRVLVSQRRRTLALLRTIGATKPQVHESVIVEGAVLGLVYSVVGVAACYLVFWVMDVAHVNFHGARVELIPSVMSVALPVACVAVITIIASSGAARSATTISPIEALQPVDIVESRVLKRGGTSLSLLLLVAGAVMCAVGIVRTGTMRESLSGAGTDDNVFLPILMSLGGIACTFVGLAGTTRLWVPRFLSGLGRLASLTGPSGTVAAGNIARNPRRVASTGTAILIAITLISTVATGTSCVVGTLNKWIDSNYSLDAYITGMNVDESTLKSVQGVDGVDSAILVPRASASTSLRSDSGHDIWLEGVYTVPDSAVGTILPDVFGGKTLEDNTIYVPRQYIDDYAADSSDPSRFADGSMVRFTFDESSSYIYTSDQDETGNHKKHALLRVRAADYSLYSSTNTGIISESTARAIGLSPQDRQVWMDIDEDGNWSETINRLNAIANGERSYSLDGALAEKENVMVAARVVMLVLFGLMAAAVLVSLIGVANTLSLSVIERRRESATLRAIGMTTGQLRASLTWESTLITVGTALVGLALGIFYGWLATYSVVGLLLDDMSVDLNWSVYGVTILIVLASAILSSLLPARRAASVPPVEALADVD